MTCARVALWPLLAPRCASRSWLRCVREPCPRRGREPLGCAVATPLIEGARSARFSGAHWVCVGECARGVGVSLEHSATLGAAGAAGAGREGVSEAGSGGAAAFALACVAALGASRFSSSKWTELARERWPTARGVMVPVVDSDEACKVTAESSVRSLPCKSASRTAARASSGMARCCWPRLARAFRARCAIRSSQEASRSGLGITAVNAFCERGRSLSKVDVLDATRSLSPSSLQPDSSVESSGSERGRGGHGAGVFCAVCAVLTLRSCSPPGWWCVWRNQSRHDKFSKRRPSSTDSLHLVKTGSE